MQSLLEVVSEPVNYGQIIGTIIAGGVSLTAAGIAAWAALRARNKPQAPSTVESWNEARTAKAGEDAERTKRVSIEGRMNRLETSFDSYRNVRDTEVNLLHRGLQILWEHFEQVKDVWRQITEVPFPELADGDRETLMKALEQKPVEVPAFAAQEERIDD